MENKEINISHEIGDDLALVGDFIGVLVKRKYLDKKVADSYNALIRSNPEIRNYMVMKEYAELTNPENPNRLSCQEARRALCEKYIMSEDNMQKVIYVLFR
jgi:hypothetical protein